ncbi:MAG: HDIG domain-containing protein, partial [Rikenellaceae bacterium]
ENYIGANVIYDEPLNAADRESIFSAVSSSKGFIAEGSEIVKRGNRIDDNIYQVLVSLENESRIRGGNMNSFLVVIGNFLYISIVLSLSFCFIFFFRKEFSKKIGNVLFLLFIYLFMATFCYVVTSFDNLNLYLIPFAIVPFYIVTFYDIRMSIFEYVSVLMICAPFSSSPMEFFFINLFAGLAGVFTMQNSYYRRKLFVAIGVILIVYVVSFIAVSFMVETDISSIRWNELIWFPFNVLIFLALYQLVYIFEKIFGFVTDITLFELCDTNHFLLRELAEKAPGTFQHSVQVANLAEAAAKEIGASPLYARTGALYHDIGKMENPLYFIENNFTDINPHVEIEPLKSVEIIKQHVSDGVKMAKKHNLPSIIIDFINTHHAKSLIYFFFHKYKEANGAED